MNYPSGYRGPDVDAELEAKAKPEEAREAKIKRLVESARKITGVAEVWLWHLRARNQPESLAATNDLADLTAALAEWKGEFE